MNGLTRFFLILLRLAIGWHFLFEGIEKVESVWNGPMENSRPFSSEPYLREATGPVAGLIQQQLGDLDEAALERFMVKDLSAGQDEGRVAPYTRISDALAKDMQDYLQRFKDHYQLTPDQQREADAKLIQCEDQVVRWILEGTKEMDRPLGSATVKIPVRTQQRLQEYKGKLQQLRDRQDNELRAFDRDVEKQNLRTLKTDIGRIRTELLADTMQPLKDALRDLLTPEQKQRGAVPDKIEKSLSQWQALDWIDWGTRWGLVVAGGCLLVGLFTRTACLGGAAFLLLLYLTMPPFPWLPELTRVEGHYYFVNKNLIEMLALMTLATTRSGYWLGLDGLLSWLNPFRRRPKPTR
jgi:uncharacterized membrane protein YphA (DoxX/SURF4 family)